MFEVILNYYANLLNYLSLKKFLQRLPNHLILVEPLLTIIYDYLYYKNN